MDIRFAAAVLSLALGLPIGARATAAPIPANAVDAVDTLVSASEQALARGDTAAAQAGFERAAALRHAAPIEMGLVRAAMQAGAYRGALAFCAHTAGDHLDEPAGTALYAWLLRIGGQEALAERVLSDTLARAPTDAVVQAARRAFDASLLAPPSGVLLEVPQRVAPQPHLLGGQAALRPGTRSVSAGVLLDDGSHALVPLLVPLPGVPSAAATPKLWLRNGLGQTTEAVVDAAAQTPFAPLGVTLLRLLTPLQRPVSVPAAPALFAPRDPFAGSVGYAFAYPASSDAALSWPTLHSGFFGGTAPHPGWRQLGLDVPAGPLGGPVFDAAGRLAGMAVGNVLPAALLPVSIWRDAVAAALAIPPEAREAGVASTAAPAAAPARMPIDEVYERGLKLALQVLVGP